MGGFDSVGTLLADIANLISEGLRIFRLADKRHWGQDEHEQHHALEEVLNEAKRDFQELTPLVGGQYEHDRKHETTEELRLLRGKFQSHIQLLKDWSRSGGPVNPVWVRETHLLQRDLHRAQCRAARRVFTSSQESSQRCLGAFLVQRLQRRWAAKLAQGMNEQDLRTSQLEELGTCAKVGGFERFGDENIAFICDFCDGHLIWEDLEVVPTERTTPHVAVSGSATANNTQWQATGTTASGPQERQVIFAPVAVANHIAPFPGDWQARLLCHLCEEIAAQPQDEDDEEEAYRPDNEFEDVAALQEHLEWQHAAAVPNTQSAARQSSNNCLVM